MSERREDLSSLAQAVATATVLGPPATVLTALLVFFGWARAEAQARYMGLHVNLFGYTTRDYVLASISALYLPLLGLVVVAIVWPWADRRLRDRLRRPNQAERDNQAEHAKSLCRAVVAGAVAVCLLLLAVAMLKLRGAELYVPCLMALAVLAAAWAVRTRRFLEPRPRVRRRVRRSASVEAWLVFALVSILLFWGTSSYAGAMGRQQAKQLEERVSQMPRAQVHSTRPLSLTVPSVTEHRVNTPGDGSPGPSLYRYEGLRLLSVGGGRYFFLHDGWTPQKGTVVVLPDEPSLWVEYRR